jgi:hypothetical protein
MDGQYQYITANVAYQPVPIIASLHDGSATATSNEFTNNYDDDENENDTATLVRSQSNIAPMELEQETTSCDGKDNTCDLDRLFHYQWTTFISSPLQELQTLCFVLISICITTPVLFGTSRELFQLFNVYFVYLPFTIHLILLLLTCKLSLSFPSASQFRPPNNRSNQYATLTYALITIVSLIDLVLNGFIYPKYLWVQPAMIGRRTNMHFSYIVVLQ